MHMADASHVGPLRPRLFHYVVLQCIDAWCAFMVDTGTERDPRWTDPSPFPLAVGLATVNLIRMGYPIRSRLEFNDPVAYRDIPPVDCRDLPRVLDALLKAGLVLRPDSYFPTYHLSYEGEACLKELQEVARRSYEFLSKEAGRWYFAAALGVGYERSLRAIPPQETIRHWIGTVATAGDRQRRRLVVDAAVQAYRESDWTGDFTFDPIYARLSSSAREYHAIVGSAAEA